MTSAAATRQLPFAATWLVVGFSVVGLLVSATVAGLGGIVFFTAYGGVGTYLAIRRPTNAIGWLLIAAAWGLGLGSATVTVSAEALMSGRLEPREAAVAWMNSWGWSLAFVAFLGIALTFPVGHLPSGPGRRPSLLMIALGVFLSVVIAVGPTISVVVGGTGIAVDAPNPLALAPGAAVWAVVPSATVLFFALFALLVVGLGALVRRARRSVGLERLQYRWLVAATAFVAVVTLVWAIVAIGLSADPSYTLIPVVMAYPTIPLAIAIAVLRYRLFEIDRIVSRTVAYAVVTAIVGAVFAIAIVFLSTAFASLAQGQTLAVAGATLLAFAIFQPVHRRVRGAVDRRFDRARFDGEATVAAFTVRLRDEIDVDAVTDDLASTTRAAVAPASVSLWLRSGHPTR